MQRRKKQLLGLVGLVLVAAMTIAAFSLPSGDASAAEEGGGGTQTVINVTIPESGQVIRVPQINSETFVDGMTIITPNVDLPVYYSHITTMSAYLTYVDRDGKEQRISAPTFLATDEAGTHTFNFQLTEQADYTAHITAMGRNGQELTETITFKYRAMRVVYNEESDDKKNPIFKIEANEAVSSVVLHVYDKSGKPAFRDEHGNEITFDYTRADFDAETGALTVTLPFAQYKLAAGDYTVVATGYNAEGDVVSVNTTTVKYAPIAPDVPGTGSMLLDDLNISRMDYLVTGLIAFGAVAGFALFLVFRKNRR